MTQASPPNNLPFEQRNLVLKNGHISTVNSEEVKKFNGVDWWHEEGELKILVRFNKIRVPFIRDGLLEASGLFTSQRAASPSALEGFKILDVGCGGGILTEGLGKVGGTVVGMDPGTANITTARRHLPDELKGRVSYECNVIEKFVVAGHPEPTFDAVVMSEVIEHVENPEEFIKTALKLLKSGGSVFITTPNRTFISWIGQILMAEHVLKVVPRGTHEWKKFWTPREIGHVLQASGCRILKTKGITYNPLTDAWGWTRITGIHYALHAVKQ